MEILLFYQTYSVTTIQINIFTDVTLTLYTNIIFVKNSHLNNYINLFVIRLCTFFGYDL